MLTLARRKPVAIAGLFQELADQVESTVPARDEGRTASLPSTAELLQLLPAQPGPQRAFFESTADIAILGGAAGGGKTWALLRDPLRHVDNSHFGAVFFRRTYPRITNLGGLWDEAERMYPRFGGLAREHKLEFEFPSGMTVKFAQMQYAKDRFDWKGAQIPLIGFDQLEEFEEAQFWYLLSRNRSALAGVKPYVRGTCNPVPEDDETGGWLNRLIAWWIDPDTGYAIPERSGVLRWFVRIGEQIHWGETREVLIRQFQRFQDGDVRPKSLTFIPAKLEDNPALESKDPDYRAWLMSQPLVDRERLWKGNWKIRPTAGKIFNRAWFEVVEALPADVVAAIRYFDKAGTEGGGKYTAGVLMLKSRRGLYYIADVERGQWSAFNRENVIKQKADDDKRRFDGRYAIWLEQEPGSGGKESAENTVLNLAGHVVKVERVTGDKLSRAKPFAAQAEAGNIKVLRAPWTEEYLKELHRFDGLSGFTDQVDGSSGAFNKLTLGPKAAYTVRVTGA
jgi:predicted phage terminase large subunit-like protein